MLIGIVPIVVGLWLGTASALQSNSENAPGIIKKNGLDVDIRSLGRQIAEEIAAHVLSASPSSIKFGTGTSINLESFIEYHE